MAQALGGGPWGGGSREPVRPGLTPSAHLFLLSVFWEADSQRPGKDASQAP